jgi:hypothetical protein
LVEAIWTATLLILAFLAVRSRRKVDGSRDVAPEDKKSWMIMLRYAKYVLIVFAAIELFSIIPAIESTISGSADRAEIVRTSALFFILLLASLILHLLERRVRDTNQKNKER